MRYFKKRKAETKDKRKVKRTLYFWMALLPCLLCLTGCGGITDLLKTEQESDMSGLKEEEDAEVQGASGEGARAVSGDALSEETEGGQEYRDIEENRVEEGSGSLTKSDLEKRREEIGLSQADVIGLQESQAGNYYYEQLGSNEKILYVECYQILMMQEEDILLTATDAEQLTKVYQCVINDHPELFYLNGYTYTQYTRREEVQYITFSGRYLYDAEEVARRQDAIDAEVESKVSGLEGSDEYEIVKRIYEDLILSTDYSMDSPDNQNICSVFLDKKSVCNGYAKAFQYMLNYMGIPCIIVNGSANGGAHAWNIAQIDGAYYHIDTTWGDPSYYSSAAEEKEGAPDIDYSYLCVTTAEISKNHGIDTAFAVPDCTAVSANYFVREGLYLYGYEEEKIAEIFEGAKAQGMSAVALKASGSQAYRELYDNLIGAQKIFDYFGTYQADGEYKIAYSGNEELYTLSFWE